jgi:tetratricopeptide (TPR) repeat protein
MRNAVASRLSAAFVFTVLLTPTVLTAQRGQSTELGEAFELERRGRYEVAAQRYRAILDRSPANLSALLGLERVLPPIDQLDSILLYIESALVLQPEHGSIRSLLLRVFAQLDQPDRLGEAARAWTLAMPQSVDPYKEWAAALRQMGDVDGARRVLEQGVIHVGTSALAQEMAELAILDADWVAAARYWREATRANPGLLSAAVTNLVPAPLYARERIVTMLTDDDRDRLSGRLAADLLVAWNRPAEGWVVLDRSLPRNAQDAVPLLRRFADRASLVRSPEGSRARGMALERLAQLSVGSAAQRARIDAASAYADAGERQAVERMLQQIAAGEGAGRGSQATAIATLIAVTAESGRVEEAEARLHEWEDRLTVDAAGALRQQVAWGWVKQGELERAEAVLGDDSTVTVLATRGWIALYRGDLRGAMDFFQGAGPRSGTREEVTQRTAILALVQSVEPDSVLVLGDALLQLARGDTTAALQTFNDAATILPARGGRAGVLAYAGRLAIDQLEYEQAERFLLAAIAADPESASAPAAEYHLARVYDEQGRRDEARSRLENLILAYPESAVVPLARRMLDRLRGAVPVR